MADEHPEKVGKCYMGGCEGCPHDYHYRKPPTKEECNSMSCKECWDQDVDLTIFRNAAYITKEVTGFCSIENSIIEAVHETIGYSGDGHYNHIRNCINAILNDCFTIGQAKILQYYCDGYTKKEIESMLGAVPSSISHSITKYTDRIFDRLKFATPELLANSNRVKETFKKINNKKGK